MRDRRRTARTLVALLLLAGLLAVGSVDAGAAVPTGFSQTTVASGLANPTAMAFAPDGRIFVATQGGALRVVKDGQLLATPFLTVTVSSVGERGLLGVAFDPDFATNGYVYVYYTATTPAIHNRVSRFTASGDVALAGSETVLLDLNNLSTATNHNGGAIHFGPDGKLYVAVGDNANGANAQSLTTLLGKILRINADGSIPSDNPLFGTATGVNRAIWATGLRNPYTFAFRPGTGRMFINDVGQSTWEEVNDGIAGANYGWPNSEGPTTTAGQTGPVYWYGHGTGSTLGCAITGGAFYAPAVAPFPSSYLGDYFFADYCGNWINTIDPANGYAVTTFATGITAPVDLRVADDGSLYYLARGTGSTTGVLGRIASTASGAPTIVSPPSDATVPAGAPVTFSVSATGSTPLTFRWQRNGIDIPGATASSYTIAATSLADTGATFRCVVGNGEGSATSASATLTVLPNTAPVATITAPTAGTTYRAGTTVSYAGSATDAEDGTLAGGRLSWEVVFHHADHTHPFLSGMTGTSGSFTIPNTGETATDVWYEIVLTATDSVGVTHTVRRRLDPQVVTLTLATSPGGFGLTLDGQPCTASCVFTSVVGMRRSIGAPSPQTLSGSSYAFGSWSDGGRATHTITTPTTNTTYTATYRLRKK
ncbi:MAG: PQQ-dependent sugar dehydrogenase [Actinomycetota bacterium]